MKCSSIPLPIILLLLISLLGSSTVEAQKVLQLERRGAVKTKKYHLGDEMLVRLHGEDIWRRGYIIDLHIEDDIIDYSFGEVHVDEIRQIRNPNYRHANKQWRRRALYGAAGALPFVIADQIASDDPNVGLAATLLGVPMLGFLVSPINALLSKRKIGKRRRLRLLDLTYLTPPPRA